MSFLHLLLTPDQEHQKVFHKVPIIGFRRAKSLKDILVRAKVPPLQKNEGFCGPCKKPRCEICKHMVNTNSFKSTTTQRTYFIRPENLKCSSENWEVRLIDQTDNVEELRKRESFWQHELDTFQPNGLNEREVAQF